MPHFVDTDVLIDVSRGNQAAIAYIDSLDNDWALSAMTALEFIAGARSRGMSALLTASLKSTKRVID